MFVQSITKNQDEKTRKSPFIYDEKILISYNIFITSVIKNYFNTKIDYEKLRAIIITLINQNLYVINKVVFQLIESIFGNSLKSVFLLFFGEYNNKKEASYNLEGNEILQLVIKN